jgi:hypothetical protein
VAQLHLSAGSVIKEMRCKALDWLSAEVVPSGNMCAACIVHVYPRGRAPGIAKIAKRDINSHF